jgi:AraC-like DNA-binding protein
MAEQTVSSAFARALLEFAVLRGASRSPLVETLGTDNLDDPNARVPFDRYVNLMRTAKALSGDQALALHFGEAVSMAKVSIVGLIGQASDTMLEAFEQLSRYVRLVVDVECAGENRFELRRERGGLWMVDTRINPNDFPELTESAFSQIVSRPLAAGLPQLALEVHLTHAEPGYVAEYERIFKAPLVFGAPWNAVKLNETVVAHRVGILPRFVFGVLIEHAEALLQELEAETTARGQVEKLLLPILHTGEASADAIAAQLNVSRQTLYRNLKAEGVTFEQVLDALRHRMAVHYLRGKKASINDTAYLVGFSDPASFSRAFKRWTGAPPGRFQTDQG